MAITISGENNNDKILASDGVIDQISGFSVVGVMTATSFTGDLTGNVVGNVTGNINNSTLLLQTGGSERFRITGNNELGIAGANYGTAGQVLTSGGSGNAVTWSTITGTTINNNANNRVITGSGTANTLEGEPNLTFNGSLLNVSGKITCDVNSDIDMSSGADGQLQIGGNGYTSAIALNDEGMQIYHNASSRAIIFGINESEKVRIDSSGRVGINDNSPDSIFSVKDTYIFSCAGGNASTGMQIGGYDAGANSYNPISIRASQILFNISGTEKVRIDSSGRVMIGNTDAGSLYAAGNNLVVGSGGASNQGITIYTGNAQQGILAFADGTSGGAQQYAGYMIYDHNTNDMLFATQATERLRIDSDGFIKQKFTSNNSTTAEGLFINNLNNGTGNNASLILSNDSGERKKAAIALIDTGNYGAGDLVFALDGADSGELHLTNDEKVRISSAGLTSIKNFTGVGLKLEGSGSDYQGMQLQVTDASASQTRNVFIDAVNETGAAVANQVGSIQSDGGSAWIWQTQPPGNRTDRRQERLRINSNGHITNTSQPTYSGVGYSGDGSVLQSNIPAIKSSTIQANIGTHYDPNTGVFTCPVAGRYLCIGAMGRRANAFQWTGLYLLKNGVTQQQAWFPPANNNTYTFQGSSFTYAPTNLSCILTCTANDTLLFGYHNNYSAPQNDASVYAQIILIG